MRFETHQQRLQPALVSGRPVPVWFQGAPVWALFLCLHVGVTGCAPGVQSVSSGMRPLTAVREEFDPEALKDDDFLIVPEADRAGRTTPSAEMVVATLERPVPKVTGFRVQISAVLDRARAEAIQSEAQSRMKVLVYVHYDPETLIYRIQMGNTRSADDARSLQIDARTAGYPDAFVVRAQIEDASPPAQKTRTRRAGFRVQIFSASNREAADRIRQRAEDLFVRNDVYVEFEAPFFKVRIGNFERRPDAERFVKVVTQHGYETAFTVSTQIQVSPRQ